MKESVNQEQLILYYYDDGLSSAERRRIAAALERDDELAQRYRALRRDLDALRAPADVTVPDGLAHRLQTSVERAARLEASENDERRARQPRRPQGSRLFAWGSAVAAALAIGVGIGLWLGEGPIERTPEIVQAPTGTSPQWSPVAFQRGLESHFRSGRADLGSLPGMGGNVNGAGQGRAALIASLLQQNRLYARLALQNDAPDLARVLRSFEPLLEQLGREDLSPTEAARLQAQLEFEFTVMLTKLTRETSQQTVIPNEEAML